MTRDQFTKVFSANVLGLIMLIVAATAINKPDLAAGPAQPPAVTAGQAAPVITAKAELQADTMALAPATAEPELPAKERHWRMIEAYGD